MAATIECGGFLFYSNFDSGNLSRVEWVPKNESAVVAVNKNGKDVPEIPDIEFNIWTRPDCMGTEFENANRTWFYFGVKGYLPCVLMKLNLVDLNRQAKMYSQGMAPVFRTVPGRPHWDRIRDKPTFTVTDNIFTLTFKFKTPENIDTVMYFAFTYPYTYTELQANLMSIDQRFFSRSIPTFDDIYYVRECVCNSLENRRIDLITITSYYNITSERETRLMHLFPDDNIGRPFKFKNKKIIFISARVHPGETPSSFVFNGLLNFLLNREDAVACALRRMYVFKMIPFLNPDGVVKGHYRTDTRGVNLNRMYLSPTLAEHPSIYAARALIQYYHNGFDKAIMDNFSNEANFTNDNNKMTQQVEVLSLEEKQDLTKNNSEPWCSKSLKGCCQKCDRLLTAEDYDALKERNSLQALCPYCLDKEKESGLFMYLDMHGHASKKGIFIYGNHFTDLESNVECMLLPKIMSLNNYNFHFTACNFTEKNMYLRDRRDGMSREGSGRVAVLKLTGLVRSYTLECNYNSGRIVNVLPPTIKEGSNRSVHTLLLPPKYNPHVFEEVGRSIGASILDLTGNNPHSRIPNSEFHSLGGMRDWLRANEMGHGRLRHNKAHPGQNQNSSKTMRGKSMRTMAVKARPNITKINKKATVKSAPVPIDRKENMAYGSRDTNLTSQSSCLSLRGKAKRDSNQRSKGKANPDTPKLSNRSIQTSVTSMGPLSKIKSESTGPTRKESPKRIKVTGESTPDRLKLREICFIKENLKKKLIAKFSTWDPSFSPKIITKQGSASKKYEPSTSKQSPRTTFKTTNYLSINCKAKRAKGSLRRLGTPNLEATGKLDKIKKRKKLISKIL